MPGGAMRRHSSTGCPPACSGPTAWTYAVSRMAGLRTAHREGRFTYDPVLRLPNGVARGGAGLLVLSVRGFGSSLSVLRSGVDVDSCGYDPLATVLPRLPQ